MKQYPANFLLQVIKGPFLRQTNYSLQWLQTQPYTHMPKNQSMTHVKSSSLINFQLGDLKKIQFNRRIDLLFFKCIIVIFNSILECLIYHVTLTKSETLLDALMVRILMKFTCLSFRLRNKSLMFQLYKFEIKINIKVYVAVFPTQL